MVICAVCAVITIILIMNFRDSSKRQNVMQIQSLLPNEIQESRDSFNEKETFKRQSNIVLGKYELNCGLDVPCSKDSFPVHIYTGTDHKDHPRLCVNGHYAFDKDLNGAGRGINVALIDSSTMAVLRAQRFDTYESDATQLEMFLEKYLQPNDIIIAFTFDEASTKLSNLARNILFELGSSSIQDLKFRSSWYLVSQKGITGFTPYEKISTSSDPSHWANLLDERMCIPQKITGQAIHPDEIVHENKARREFCSKHNGYGEFCSTFMANEILNPVPLTNSSMENHPIFSVPIAVMAGLSQYFLPMTLETIIRQPGINPNVVTVYYLPVFEEAENLAALFRFKSVKMNGVRSYKDQVQLALSKTVESFPEANYMIFIDEELALSPDFLFYMAQALPLLDRDPTLYSISAWNENGYVGTSSNPEAAYRVEGFPGLAFMISKATYIRQMKGSFEECCSRRSWDGWILQAPDVVEMVVPDVSRVVRRPYEGLGDQIRLFEHMFNRERITSMSGNQYLTNPMSLIMHNYEKEVEELIKNAVILEMTYAQLTKCGGQSQLSRNNFERPNYIDRHSYVLYYQQKNQSDVVILQMMCRCFGLFYDYNERPRGIHNEMLRFSIEKSNVFLVSSLSPYYKLKPSNQQPLQDVT